jgi:hypothetical protein
MSSLWIGLLLLLGACSSSAKSTAPAPRDAGVRDAAGDDEPAAGGGGDQGGASGRGGRGGTQGLGGRGGGGAGGMPAAGSGGGSAGHVAAGSGGGESTAPGTTLLVGAGDYGLRGWSSDGEAWMYCGDKAAGNDHVPNLLRNIGYGDGVFIAVGGDANGMVMRTLDGEHWQEDVHPKTACKNDGYPSSCTNWMGAVAFLDGTWVAGGGNGAMMRSRDGGVTWTTLHSGFPEKHIRSMGAGGGRFLAGTDGGGLAVSKDSGDSWTQKSPWSGAAADAVLQFAFGAGTFIAFSSSGGACFVSSDLGDSWEACAASVKSSQSFIHDGTGWVTPASGGYATSPDAKTWTSHSASNVPSRLLFDGKIWFGRSGGTIYRGATLDTFASVATKISDFRGWTLGAVFDKNVPVKDVPVCTDKR